MFIDFIEKICVGLCRTVLIMPKHTETITHFVGAFSPCFVQNIYITLSLSIYIDIYIYLDIRKLHFFWSGLKSSERPKIEQLLILPSFSHIWNNQKYDAKWRRTDAKDQLFDTNTVSLNPSLLAQKWFLGPHPKIHKDRKLCGSRTVQVYIHIHMYIYIHICKYEYICTLW